MTQEENNTIETTNRLSVQVSLAGLSFLITDVVNNEITFFKDIRFSGTLNPEGVLEEIKAAYNELPELNRKFKNVTVVHRNNLFSIVPKVLFDENRLSDYLKFTAKILPTDYIDFDDMDTYGMVNVYVPYTNVNNYFFDLYGEFTFQHGNTVFINTILNSERNEDVLKMYVHICEDAMDVLITKNKSVQLCNTFSCGTPEDFIYYILFAAEQMQMNPENFPLLLTGMISEDSPLFEIAYIYVRNVSIMEKKPAYRLDETIASTDIFRTHFTLVNG